MAFPLVVTYSSSVEPVLPLGSKDGYLTFDETNNYLATVNRDYLQGFSIQPFDIGKSRSANVIKAICIGKCNDAKVPSVLFTGLHHAREPISLMTLIYTLHHISLMSYYKDLETVALLESRQLWFIPLVNPDGYIDNLGKSGGDRIRRKNTLPGCSQIKRNGVDLNRNYETCWSGDTLCENDVYGRDCGNSPNQCAEDYRGSSAFSEPETQAIRDFVGKHPNIKAALNYHSYGENLYWPYSCVKMKNSESVQQKHLFESIAAEITNLNGYKASNVLDSLHYNAAGDATDWMFDKHGIIAYTPEVGPNDAEAKADGRNNYDLQDAYGFWPPSNKIPMHSNKSVNANIHLAWLSGPCYILSKLQMQVTTKSGQNSNSVSLSFKIKNIGLKKSGENAFLQIIEGDQVRLPSRKLTSTVDIGGRNEVSFHLAYDIGNIDGKDAFLVIRDIDNYECATYLIDHRSKFISDVIHTSLGNRLCKEYVGSTTSLPPTVPSVSKTTTETPSLSGGGSDKKSSTTNSNNGNTNDVAKSKTSWGDNFFFSILPFISGTFAGIFFVCFVYLKCKERDQTPYRKIDDDQIELGEFQDTSPEPAFKDIPE
jgi:murein tripeptide amidase MpaA